MPRVMPIVVLAACVLLAGEAWADVYKYVDAKGNVYFTDTPLSGAKYRLAWKRESDRLVGENRRRLASLGRSLDRVRGLVPTSSAPAALPPAPVTKGASADRNVATRRARFERVINAYARVYRLSPELLHAVIRTESGYNDGAVSRAGAEGLMQLMPDTAARYGVKDSFNPVENVRGGAAYLRDLLDLFGQDLRLALAGYNAGENAVIRNGNQIPPYAETRNYVRQVLQHLSSERTGG